MDENMISLLMPTSVGNVDPTAVSRSARWKYWFSIADPRRCPECESMHGKVYESGGSPAYPVRRNILTADVKSCECSALW